MALWLRSGGCGVSRRFPGIWAPRPPVAAKKVWKNGWLGEVCCSLHQEEADTRQQQRQHLGIMCDLCSGSGWLLCEFCQGEKTNVKSKSSRFYRRCPDCKAVGLVLCPKCKVFKCLIFPDFSDCQT